MNRKRFCDNQKQKRQLRQLKCWQETNLSLLLRYKLSSQVPQNLQDIIESNLPIAIRIVNLKDDFPFKWYNLVNSENKQEVTEAETIEWNFTKTYKSIYVTYIPLFVASLHEN